MRPEDFVGYRPHQIARILRSQRGAPRPYAPGERKRQQAPAQSQDSALFPGGNVRELWNLPQFPPPLRHTETAPESLPITTTEPFEHIEEPIQTPFQIDDPALDQLTERAGQPTSPAESESTPESAANAGQTPEIAEIPQPAEIPDPAPAGTSTTNQPIPSATPKRRPRRQPQSKASAHSRRPGTVSLRHHKAHCTICGHPDRNAIEEAFFHWQRPSVIAADFQLGNRKVVHRHATAFGLYHQRAANSRRSLEFVIEQAENVTATPDSIVRAVRAHSCLGEDGRWREPVRESIVTYRFVNLPDPLDGTIAPQNPTGNQPKISRDGCRDISSVTPAPSMKVPKFLGTIFDAWFARNSRLSAPKPVPLLDASSDPAP